MAQYAVDVRLCVAAFVSSLSAETQTGFALRVALRSLPGRTGMIPIFFPAHTIISGGIAAKNNKLGTKPSKTLSSHACFHKSPFKSDESPLISIRVDEIRETRLSYVFGLCFIRESAAKLGKTR